MKKLLPRLILSLWIAALAVTGVWYLLFAPRSETYDAQENRNLAAAPELSLRTFWSGEFSEDAEPWLLDRFWGRGTSLDLANGVKDLGSIANYEDSLAIMGSTQDALTEQAPDDATLEQMANDLLAAQPTSSPSPEPDPEDIAPSEPTQEPVPTRPPKPEANIEDFPENPAILGVAGGVPYPWQKFSRVNALAVASVLDRVASLLPENGSLVYTMVPQSYIGNLYLSLKDKESFTSETEDIVHAFTKDNVTALSSAAILDEHIKAGEYVYFRSDMHWTPEGTYIVYQEMAKAAGIDPTDWDDFDITVEAPFLGTYYRDNPTDYMAANPDSLTLVSPAFDLEWRRITAPDEYKLIPLLDDNARSNDRYTVYLGGPAGPWTYAKSENGISENCLVITDSFGLAFVPMIATNYGETHYLDPRYYNYETVGYTVKEMIEKHNIKDVYVVVGDLHSYGSSFLLTQLSSQLGDQ